MNLYEKDPIGNYIVQLQTHALGMNEYRKYSDVIEVEKYISLLEAFIDVANMYRDSEEEHDKFSKEIGSTIERIKLKSGK